MRSEVTEYTSIDIAKQIDRLKMVPVGINNPDGSWSPLIVVGRWSRIALDSVKEFRLQRCYSDYMQRLGPLWTPENVLSSHIDELVASKHYLSEDSKILNTVYTKTEGELKGRGTGFEAGGKAVIITPGAVESQEQWVEEEYRHLLLTKASNKILLGNDQARIEDQADSAIARAEEIIKQVRENTAREKGLGWRYEDHDGLEDEAGHEIFVIGQERDTAGAYGSAIKLGRVDYLAAGVSPDLLKVGPAGFGVIGLYSVIAPEESRHSKMARDKARARFGLHPIHSFKMLHRVQRRYKMPAIDLIPESIHIPRILHDDIGPIKLARERRAFFYKFVTKLVTGLDSPETIPEVVAEIDKLNTNLYQPEIRILRADGKMEPYKEAV